MNADKNRKELLRRLPLLLAELYSLKRVSEELMSPWLRERLPKEFEELHETVGRE